jgi:hypothetical protein
MPTTIEAIRQDYLNLYVHRVDDPGGGASNKPWSDAECDRLIGDALTKLWPKLGIRVAGDLEADGQSDVYAAPTELGDTFRVSAIDLLDADGRTVDRVSNWRYGAAGELLIRPLFASGTALRVWAWTPFAADASDLPDDLIEAVAHRAAGRAYSGLAAELVQSQRQQNLDSGRVVSYQDAIGFAAYHERLYQEGVIDHPAQISYAPRASRRR